MTGGVTSGSSPDNWSRWRRVLRMVRARRYAVTAILALTLALGGLSALDPLLLKVFLDQAATGGAWPSLLRTLLLLLALNLVREAVAAASNWLTWRTRIDFQYQLLDATVDRLHSLPLSYHRSQDVGGIMTRLDRGIAGVLQRLYDPTHGTIRVDDHDLRKLKQRSLRRHIGVVLQDGLIFNDSVKANIAYGRPEAAMEDIVAAAKAAHAHEFIMELAHGYQTVLGERGSHLSGGQRQRLTIARALLKDPAILVLDEATSALDAESEALVQEALSRLTRGRTSFVIAHRLSTVMHADRIVVVRDGRILEHGTHADLMAAGGYYASLVERQMRGFRPPGDRPS